jgi:hypothetical protein
MASADLTDRLSTFRQNTHLQTSCIVERSKNMHKTSILLVIAGFWMTSSSPALAEITHCANPLVVGLNGEHIQLNFTSEGAGWNSGGPFTATLYHADNTKDVWQTFCVEAGPGGDEEFSPGQTYKVWKTDLHVATATMNYVTDAAKWLYYESLHNPSLLAGYVPGDITSDSYLQEAIWHGVLKVDNTPLSTPFSGNAVTWFNAAAAATAGGIWADANSVRVISPAVLEYTSTGDQAQSQLYEVCTVPVPEPFTPISFAIGIFALLMYAWQRRPQ